MDADDVLDATDALTYNLSTQSHAGAFTIDADTGAISVLDGSLIDFENPTPYTVTVEVTDLEPATGNTYTEQFSISVNDLVEANNAPTDLSSGIELNTDGGNDAFLFANDGGALLGGLSTLTFESTFVVDSAQDEHHACAVWRFDGRRRALRAGRQCWHVWGSESTRIQHPSLPELFDLLLNGELHHFALSWDNTSGSVAIYVDGEFVESQTGSRPE